MGDYDDDIDAQIAALQAKAQQQAESRQQNASASGSKRRQLCARGCHLYKDDPEHLSSSKDKEKKGRKRGKAKPGKAKHVCPGACEGASVCPQRNNPDAWKRLHAPELAMEKLLKRKKRLEKVGMLVACLAAQLRRCRSRRRRSRRRRSAKRRARPL